MQKEVNEKTIRLRYIRVLEKFVTKSISLLKYDNFDKELFKKATIKAFNELQKTKSCDLYSEYPVAVRNLTLHIMQCIDNDSQEDEWETKPNNFEEEKASILKQANLLAKLKNNNRYKKDKHKHKKFNDGY
ncbi:hypothetical protein ALC152_06120 [Arcobacter sp. 15-2]|uniref:hypothetical protein n=1 Tax=Arcobacter sp. 15-2 TaxID=3374109 RepID=UPI00399D4599